MNNRNQEKHFIVDILFVLALFGVFAVSALDCGYVDAVATHEMAILQYMEDYGAEFRILDKPLLVTGIGVAFSNNDNRGLAQRLTETFAQMRQDGTLQEILGRYLEHPATYLEVESLGQ